MDEPKHAMGSKPDVVCLCPFCIGAAIRNIWGKHCPQIGHLLTAFALGKAFGIDCALLCLRIEELTPGVQVDHQQASVHSLLVTTQAALGAFALPGGGVAGATHTEPLQRAWSTCPGHPGVWEAGWRGL